MRQLPNPRGLLLATVAKNRRKQTEDASAALSNPSALLLVAKSRTYSSVPAPAPDPTFAQASAPQTNYINTLSSAQNNAATEIAWRGFAAGPGHGAAHGAGNCAGPAAAQSHSPHHPFPVITSTSLYPASRVAVPNGAVGRSDSSFAPNLSATGGAVHQASRGTDVPSSLHDTPSFIRAGSAAAAPTATTVSSTTTSTATAYNELKDGAFSGRIVQHDGSRAVHLLVAGTNARDYHLRMVRCHAKDELRFTTHGSASSQSGGAQPAVGHPRVARGEDVSFGTFVYRQIRDTITATFLPAGYPDTTGPNYVRFMAWQGVNNIAMTANSVLASTFMLYAVGLGAGSIPTAGALNWVLKDGMGQLGTLLFGKTIAHHFDVHSKTWFFLSALMLQAAAALELMTVLVPAHFLLMGSLANTLKGLAWMAAGSTRSVFHLSFARDNNIADVTAKGTSQYIFASLVGTAGGALMCAAVGQSGGAAAACFSLLAAANVGSAYLAVQAIPLSTLNATRLQLLVDSFLTSISPSDTDPRRRHGRRRAADDDDDGDGASYQTAGGRFPTSRYGNVGSSTDLDLGDDDGEVARGVERRVGTSSDGGDGGVGGSSSRSYGSSRAGGVVARSGGLGSGGDRDRDRGGVGVGGDDRSGPMRRWPRPRAYRTTDRCYIGPSTHEYEMMYDDSLDPQVPTPLELCPLDPPVPYFSRTATRLSPPITVGSRLEHIVEGNANLLVMLLNTFKYAHFIVVPRRGVLHVVLHERADPRDIVQAYMQACILRRRLRNGDTQPLPDADEQTAELRLELQESLAAAERLTTIFMSAIEASGWTVEKVVVEAQRRRAKW